MPLLDRVGAAGDARQLVARSRARLIGGDFAEHPELDPDLAPRLGALFWRDAPLAPVIRDAEPQELALLRSRHRALRFV